MAKSREYPQLRFGPFTLAGEPCCLGRDTAPIEFRPMSLQVLRYLAERPGRLVSKDELLDRNWRGRIISDRDVRQAQGNPGSAKARSMRMNPSENIGLDTV